jgi:ATP-binding cassette subfamily B protein
VKQRSLRDLPRLVISAIRLAWAAGRRELMVLAILQVLIGIGTAAQLLVAKEVLSGFLTAGTRGGHGLASLIPVTFLLGVLIVAVSFAGAAVAEEQRLLGEMVASYVDRRLISTACSVDLITFESSEFQDRLQRALTSSGSRPFQLTTGLLRITGAALSAAAIAAALLLIEPWLVVLLLFAWVPLWFATTSSSRDFYAFAWRSTGAERLRSYLFRVLTGSAGAKELRAFGVAKVLADRYARLTEERLAAVRRLIRKRLTLGLAGTLGGYAFTALIVGALGYLALTGGAEPVPALASIPAVILLTQRLQNLSFGATSLYEGALFMEDLDSFLKPEGEVESGPGPDPLDAIKTLSVEDVSFTYPGAGRPALDGVSMEIRRDEVVALVGENGSGKTTLAKLLCGLYSPGSGTIRWNGDDLAEIGSTRVRSSVAVLFQEFVRYMLTARENIGMGKVELLDDLPAIKKAAEMAGADSFLRELPKGYETSLTAEFEGGVNLSGGQWQRVALARALVREAPLLVLDEPTAAVDARAETEIFELIRRLGQGRATLLISHRFSTVMSADRIYVLRKGRVVEAGSHDQLILNDGLYAELYKLQARAFLPRDAVGETNVIGQSGTASGPDV